MSLNLNIKSIAVVGASQDITKLGTVIYNNIQSDGFAGAVYPVNPNYSTIMGDVAYQSVSAIERPVDTVVVVVPAKAVLDVARDVASRHDVRNLIVISAGFSETGTAGLQLQKELTEICTEREIRLFGPNCLGIMLPHLRLNASFANSLPKPGKVAFLAQSGAFATAVLDMAAVEDFGFASFITVGNKADVSELDLLKEWGKDPEVSAIGMYLEGFVDGNRFVEEAMLLEKPIVLLNPGTSKAAKNAIASHTGSLVGSAETIAAALRKAGVIQVKTITELYSTLKICDALAKRPIAHAKMCLITNAGGPGVMVSDLASEFNLPLAELSEGTQASMRLQLPPAASAHNPVDVLGDASAERFLHAMQVATEAPEVEVILALLTPQYVTQVEETAKAIGVVSAQSPKPIIPIFIGGETVWHGLKYLWHAGIPAFSQPEFALQALTNLRWWQQQRPTVANTSSQVSKKLDLPDITVNPGVLSADDTQKLAYAAGLTMPLELIISNVDEALEFAHTTGYPLVLKLTSADALHKTERGGVVLDIDDEQKLRNAFSQLISIAPAGELLLQTQVAKGLELFLGLQRDGDANVYTESGRGFGHLLVFGTGGIYTEVYKDTASLLLPATRTQIRAMVEQTKAAQIIAGARGKQPLAMELLLDELEALMNLALSYPHIKSADINPLVLSANSATCVDVKLVVG